MAPDSTSGLLVDGLVVFLYFAVIIAIGLYKGRGSKDLESFAVGNRNIPWWAVLASILAAEISAATFLGAPGEGYEKRNFTYAQLALGTILARVVIAYIFIKPYYDFRVVSIYEYLLLRFGTRTKNTASAIFLITRALASGTRLYVAAIVFVMGYEMVSGETLNIWQQVWIYIVALSVITALTAVYTALGGIKAVVWTDVIQACIMFGSLGFAIWSLLRAIPGGWQGATAALNQPDDWQFFSSGVEASRTFGENVRSILESEYTIWAALIGSTFTTLATHGTDQDMVQRMLTAKDHHRSRLSLILSGLGGPPAGDGVSLRRNASLGVLPGARQERSLRVLHRARTSARSARSPDCRHFRHRDGVIEHRPQRPRNELHRGLVSALHTKGAPRKPRSSARPG